MDTIIANAIQQQQAQTALKTQMTVLQKTRSVEKEIGEALIGLIAGAALQSAPSLDAKIGRGIDITA
ncbi:MAG: hypothetical protein LBQ66_07795 [Planctomycetaceae bacterium]|jgi:hypothetical protein|nr:hypothetical protein [Planctomycetaceae bacterium]